LLLLLLLLLVVVVVVVVVVAPIPVAEWSKAWSAVVRLLGLRVRIPPEAWMSVSL